MTLIPVVLFLTQIGDHDEVLTETPTVAPVYYALPPHVQAIYGAAKQAKLEAHQTMELIDAWGDKMLAWPVMINCLSGPSGDLKRECVVPANRVGDLDPIFDRDQDGDLDMRDVALMLRAVGDGPWRHRG